MKHRRLLAIVSAGVVTALLSLGIESFPYSDRAIGVAVGVLLLIATGALLTPPITERRAFSRVLIPVALLGLAVVLLGPFHHRLFGDGSALIRMVSEGTVYPRWLGITSILRFFYHTIGMQTVVSADVFVRLVSWGAMVGGLALAGRISTSSFPFLILLTVPLNLVFLCGHIEVYPALTGALVVAFAVLERWSLERWGALKLCLVAAVLPWLYLGFLPLGAFAVGATVFARPRVGVGVALGAGGIFLALIAATWSGGFESYLSSLSTQIDTGAEHLVPRYRRIVPEDASFYFPLSAALSAVHLRDLGSMIFYGAGWCLPLVWIAALPRLMCTVRWRELRAARDFETVFLVTSAVFYLHYLLFMIPRLGPQRDLDLFFMSYIVLTYTVGRLYLGREKEVEKAQECETVFWSGLTAGAIIAVPLVVR